MATTQGSGSLTNLIEDDIEGYTINSDSSETPTHEVKPRQSSSSSLQLPLPTLCRREENARIVDRDTARAKVMRSGVKTQYLGYAFDNFTTLVNAPWWLVILIFSAAYVLSWVFFAGIWMLTEFVEGSVNNRTCTTSVTDFNSAFLLSLETQVTIGYGNVNVAESCTLGSFVLIIQTLIGIFIDAVMLGLIFAKITRPRHRRRTIVFSKQAVVYEEGGHQYFEVRIADLRQSQMVEAHVRLQLYWYELVDPINQRYKFKQCDLDCGYEDGTDRVILIMPVCVRHRIKEGSPLYKLNATKLSTMDHLEIVVILEGIVEPTGLTAQALWSYTKDEILVDHQFAPIISKSGNKWEVDFSRIDAVLPMTSDVGDTSTSM